MTLEKLYDTGAVKFEGSVLGDLGLPPATLDFLKAPGLPVFDSDKPMLGLRFGNEHGVLAQGSRRFLVIGEEVWRDDLLIGIEAASGEVHTVSSKGAEAPAYINASVTLLIEFLADIQAYLAAASQDVPAPVTMTSEQALARLEAFRRGEIKPAPPAQRFDREKELLRIKKTFRRLDPRSVEQALWWGRMLEQARDGLI